MARIKRSRVTITFVENLVSRRGSGDFYWSVSPYITRHDYYPASERDITQEVVSSVKKKLKHIPAKKRR